MTGFMLIPLVPTVALISGGLLGIAVSVKRVTLRLLGWGALAGYAGGSVASLALSAEYLGSGTTGTAAIAGVGGLVGAAMTGQILQDCPRKSASARKPRERRDASSGSWPFRVGLAVVLGGGAVAAAAAGLALIAIVVLLLLAATSLTRRGWPFSTALFTAALAVSAAEVVLGRIVLSRLGAVGDPVGTIAVASLVLVPLLIHLGDRATWRGVARRIGLIDVAAVAVAAIATRSWLITFDGLNDSQTAAHLQRLGEDNAAHLMMLTSTTASGTALGESAKSIEINSGFSTYFPGGSLWQAAVGALLPDLSDARLFVVSTGVLLALLAGGASSVEAFTRFRWGSISALAVLVVGVVGTRASLAMYEIGFPGQLLVACLLVAALALVLAESRVKRGSWLVIPALLVFALAAWWTWSLAAPIFLLPVGVLAYQHLQARIPQPRWVWRATIAGGALVFALAVLVKRAKITSTLDSLSLDGLVFRSVPIWFAFGLCLGLPLAYRVIRRREPVAGLALVMGVSGATLALTAWQLTRTGVIAYYSYKLEYLTLAVGWAASALAIARIAGQLARRWPVWINVVAGLLVLTSVPALAVWPGKSYDDWQVARGVSGADTATTCAIDRAREYKGSIVIATGFGEKLANYLTTKAMDVGAGNNDSKAFWKAILFDAPTTWPWPAATRKVVLVQGPLATAAETKVIVDAGAAQGVTVTVAPEPCPEPS